MESETEVWIVMIVGGLISIADNYFNFLSKTLSFLIGGAVIFGFLFLTIKYAVKEALKEHNFDD